VRRVWTPCAHCATNSAVGLDHGCYTFPLITDNSSAILLSVTDKNGMSKPTDLVQGTLDLLILRVIALEPIHGWAIAQRIRQMSNDELRVGQGSLYPALHKLEQQGWIDSEWAISDNNRRAKYYKLTAAGRRALKAETAQWERLSAAISMVVRPA
jgi:PadR family transcriptional regulator, regulatory protein PadR